jgi:diguanylate cyclase (GGDEF)-like protein
MPPSETFPDETADMAGPTANRRVLLIDDMPSIHEDFRRILSGTSASGEIDAAEAALFGTVSTPAVTGFDLDSAYQGREGVEKVRASLQTAHPYALAFVDMRMPPGWDGMQTIQEIWKADPRLQIVICTAHSDYPWDEVLGTLGVEDRLLVLKKPFDSIEVAQLARALTTKWDMTRRAELKVSRLELAVGERTEALEVANRELAEVVQKVTRLATHDALTGLPNRLLFADRASQALAVARRDGSCPAVLMLDLDRFKQINDTRGHQEGDLLLEQVGQRLLGVLRPGDTAARLGGDEFALLLTDGGVEGAVTVAARITTALEAPFRLTDGEVGMEASIGIAVVVGEEESSLTELLRQADIAMYKAKADRSGVAIFAASNDDSTADRLVSIGELRQAFDREEFVVFYQPKVAVDDGALLGVEALVRWQHPTRGLLLPGEFMALIEGSTLNGRLTTLVIDSALRFCRRWLDRGLRLPIAVNVSARSLCDTEFPAIVADRLAVVGVPADLLTVELTEGTIMAYPDMAVGILRRLREIGVQLSVDDFGTGHSSLAYLKNLPVTELKIDRTFIKGLTSDAEDAIIIESATELAHNLGLSIVAEGVEDQETLNALQTLGVDVAQGFHLGRPMAEDMLERWVAERPDLPASAAGPAATRHPAGPLT